MPRGAKAARPGTTDPSESISLVRAGELDLMRGACAVAGFAPQILFEINDCQTAQGFVAAGMGIAVLPHLALLPLNPNVTVHKPDGAPSRSVPAVRLVGGIPTPSTQTALQLLRRAAIDASP